MKIAFLFYEGMTALDAVGPHEILCRIPGAEVYRVARKAGAIQTDSGLVLTADLSIEEVPEVDILLVPGAGNAATLRQYPEVLEWIRKIHEKTKWTTSVCTGSLILGAAGVLAGVKATTHWATFDRLKDWKATPVKERVVEDGKLITAAGVSAGIDMALVLAAKVEGKLFAQAIQLAIEYDPAPPFDVGSPEKANPMVRAALLSRMSARFERI
ncbi:MAG: DJ-1/PfpI family protein [Verrucomicrobia bacterium]|nr:DJ-1/PfpI family protein [Verrucomicrobiota bacterium]